MEGLRRQLSGDKIKKESTSPVRPLLIIALVEELLKMKLFILVLVIFSVARSQYVYEEPLLYGTFPQDFAWGVATAAYQVISSLGRVDD